MAHWLFTCRQGLGSSDVKISTNSEHISLADKDMKLCAQRVQNETKGKSDYDAMATGFYPVLTLMDSATAPRS